jgi:hypothetical protein
MRSIKFVLAALAAVPGLANALVILDGSTPAYYNDSLGELLNGTNPVFDDNGVNTFLFPNNNSQPNDPTIASVGAAPSLAAAAGVLGNWLADPANLNANWSGPQVIPGTWAVNSETAIVYAIDAGAGLSNTNLLLDIGVDNGIFVWLNGVFVGGQLAPGVATIGEFSVNLPDLIGVNYLQVLREDHGGGTGYSIRLAGDVTPVPEPGTLMLLSAGLLSLGFAARRRRV